MASLGEEAVRKLTVSGYSRPAPYGSAAAVINNGAGRERVNLGKFGVELANLVLVPGRRTEPVMGDGRDHEKPGRRRIQALIYPVGVLHADFLPRVRGM
jgi:hypothetical protein